VLVHSPLLGPFCWPPIAAALRKGGDVAVVPDLTPALGATQGHVRRQAELVRAAIADDTVTLVTHSAAGPLAPVIADTLAAASITVIETIFVDATLPHPGRSRFDALPAAAAAQVQAIAVDGWAPAWPSWWSDGQLRELVPDAQLRAAVQAQCPRLPLTLFTEAMPEIAAATPSRYVRLSAAYDAAADDAERDGWPVRRLAGDHLALLTEPDLIVDALAAERRD
jgi:hypothetical protein